MLTETIGQRRSSNQGLTNLLARILEDAIYHNAIFTHWSTRPSSQHLPGGSTISLVLSVLSLSLQSVHSYHGRGRKTLGVGPLSGGRLQLMLKIPSEVNAGETHRTEGWTAESSELTFFSIYRIRIDSWPHIRLRLAFPDYYSFGPRSLSSMIWLLRKIWIWLAKGSAYWYKNPCPASFLILSIRIQLW